MLICGINPVLEALRAKRATLIRVSPRADDRLTQLVRLAAEQGVTVQRVTVDELDRLAGGGGQRHQGVIGDVTEAGSYSVEDLVIGAKAAPLIVVLDSIEDPHNVGAILRTVDAAGGDGVVRQSRHAARLDGAAARASAGAVAHVKIAEVVKSRGRSRPEGRRRDDWARRRRPKKIRSSRLHVSDCAGGGSRGHRAPAFGP
jgi:23S rRNA (guanosine2251-2'-O)-methyltransferase